MQTLVSGHQSNPAGKKPLTIELRTSGGQLVRLALANLVIQNLERRLRLLHRNIRLATRHDAEPLMGAFCQTSRRQRTEHGRHHHRHAHVGTIRKIDSVERRRRDAEDCYRLFVDEYCLTDDVWIFAEAAVPEVVTKDRDWMRAGNTIVVLGEETPGPRSHTKYFKEVSTDEFATHALILIGVTNIHLRAAASDYAREDFVAIAQILVHR